MTSEIDRSLNEILDVMANVSASYAVWRELTDAVNRDKYESIKNQYEEFFVTIDYANFAMVVNGLNMLFEGKDNTHNIRNALLMQRKLGKLYEYRIDKWLHEVNGWKPIIKKIILLRSNVFSHRGRKGTASEFMQKAAITPDEIGSLISNAEKLLKDFHDAVSIDMTLVSFSGRIKELASEVMTALVVKNA